MEKRRGRRAAKAASSEGDVVSVMAEEVVAVTLRRGDAVVCDSVAQLLMRCWVSSSARRSKINTTPRKKNSHFFLHQRCARGQCARGRRRRYPKCEFTCSKSFVCDAANPP